MRIVEFSRLLIKHPTSNISHLWYETLILFKQKTDENVVEMIILLLFSKIDELMNILDVATSINES